MPHSCDDEFARPLAGSLGHDGPNVEGDDKGAAKGVTDNVGKRVPILPFTERMMLRRVRVMLLRVRIMLLRVRVMLLRVRVMLLRVRVMLLRVRVMLLRVRVMLLTGTDDAF